MHGWQELTAEEFATEQGIGTKHEKTASGEFRFRLVAGDGSSYVRTIASDAGGWQHSHYHRSIVETYIVQAGWIALVEYQQSNLTWHILSANEVYTTTTGVAHNVYLPAGTVLHTVKHGDGGAKDWHAHDELDKLTRSLNESSIPRTLIH